MRSIRNALRALLASILLALFMATAASASPSDVIHIRASELVRWPKGEITLMDLRGDVKIFQGESAIHAPRIMLWFHEERTGAVAVGVVEVFAEAKATFLKDGVTTTSDRPTLTRLTTAGGVLVDATSTITGEIPAEDAFRRRAEGFRATGSLPPDVPESAMGDVRWSADTMTGGDVSETGATFTLHGDAQIAAKDFILSADTIRLRVSFTGGVYQSSKPLSAYAEGSVDLIRGKERVSGQAVYLDLVADEGLILDPRVRVFTPMRPAVQFHAEAVRELTRERFVAEGPGWITTSQMAVPHYQIKGDQMQVVSGPGLHRLHENHEKQNKDKPAAAPSDAAAAAPQGHVLASRDNVLYIAGIPVFYWPFVAKDITTGPFLIKSVVLGQSSLLGAFFGVDWNLYDLGILYNEWSQLTLNTIYYTKRGPGVGLNFEYKGKLREGFARAFYIRDSAEFDDKGIPVPREDRGEMTWRHIERLSDQWTANFELGYLSDFYFLRTYDRHDFDEGKDHETAVMLRWRYENMLLTGLVRERINDFENVLEREGVGFHIIGEPLFDGFLWTSHTDAAHLHTLIAEQVGTESPNPVTRFDTVHELSRPFQVGPVRLDPYLTADTTLFSAQADGGGAAGRVATGYGIRGATNFYRTWDVHNDTLGIDRLRHVITPEFNYRNLWFVSKGTRDFIQNDEIDALAKAHVVTLGVRNRWQTWREVDGVRKMVDFIVMDADYNKVIQDKSIFQRPGDSIEASVQWQVNNFLTFSSQNNYYNVQQGRLEKLQGEVTVDYWKPIRLVFMEQYLNDPNATGPATHVISGLRMAWQPETSRWRIEVETTYDFKGSGRRGLGTGVFLVRQLEEWEVSVGAEFNKGRTNETVFSFSVTPPGLTRPPLSRFETVKQISTSGGDGT